MLKNEKMGKMFENLCKNVQNLKMFFKKGRCLLLIIAHNKLLEYVLLVILHVFHIANSLILEICQLKFNKKVSNIVNIIVKNANINIVFLPFKVGDLFSVKESIPK